MANRICPQCGEEYVEWASTCASCAIPLVELSEMADLRRLPEALQVVYELGGWTLDQRTEVAAAMAESGVPHSWDGDDLIVHIDHEQIVDTLLEPIEAAGPRAESDPDAQTEYDLGEWPAADRAVIVERLVEAGVPHTWEGTLLLVGVDDEEVVDDILDDFEQGGDPGALIDDGRETPFEVLESMFIAAERLRHDGLDADGVARLAEALEAADPDRPPFGIDLAMWRRAMELADELADAVEEADAGGEDRAPTRATAGDLHHLLRPYV